MRKSLFYKISIVTLLSLSGLIIVLAIYAILQKYTDLAEINLLKITQLLQQLFVFGIPAIIGIRFLNKNNGISNTNKTNNISIILLAIVFVFVSVPAIDMLLKWNEGLHLPESMSGIEMWIRTQETNATILTEKLLATNTVGGLGINIIIVALSAAVCEELFFRGFLLRSFTEHIDTHIAVWLTAIIFSFIHFQFLGFIPRIVLGAVFGYMAIYGKSLWAPIAAHFTNNAIGVVAFYLSHNKITEIKTENFGTVISVASLVLAIATIYLMRRIHKKYSRDLFA